MREAQHVPMQQVAGWATGVARDWMLALDQGGFVMGSSRRRASKLLTRTWSLILSICALRSSVFFEL